MMTFYICFMFKIILRRLGYYPKNILEINDMLLQKHVYDFWGWLEYTFRPSKLEIAFNNLFKKRKPHELYWYESFNKQTLIDMEENAQTIGLTYYIIEVFCLEYKIPEIVYRYKPYIDTQEESLSETFMIKVAIPASYLAILFFF